MNLRHIETATLCHSSTFNTASLSEIVVYYPGGPLWEKVGSRIPRKHYWNAYHRSPKWLRRLIAAPDCTSDFQSDYEVQIAGQWKPLPQAFADRDLIRDNYNTHFFEPTTEEDRARGYV